MGWLKLLVLLPLSILFSGDDNEEDEIHQDIEGFDDGMGNYVVKGELVPEEIAKAEAQQGRAYNNHR